MENRRDGCPCFMQDIRIEIW